MRHMRARCVSLLLVLGTWAFATAPAASADNLVAWSVIGRWVDPLAGDDYIAVAAGARHFVSIKRDGSLVAWGENTDGQTSVPSGNEYTTVAAGDSHSVAIRRDGSLVGWGKNTSGQTSVPGGNDYTAVAAGRAHSVALKRDGSVVAWGANENHQTDVPPGNDYVAIAASTFQGRALKRDGTLEAWGLAVRSFGQLRLPVANGGFTAIAAGADNGLALRLAKAPTITVPSGLRARATSVAGASVTYNATVNDDLDGFLTPECAPASGSVFAIGLTRVRCTAADATGNQAATTFDVIVGRLCSVKLTSRKVLVQMTSRRRYGRAFVTASCGQAARVTLGGRITLRGRQVNLAPLTAQLAANRSTSLPVKLPSRAISALRHRARVSVALTMTATTDTGREVTRKSAARLRAVGR